jgi:glycosyltransferase involved in cell wall biosynthesis
VKTLFICHNHPSLHPGGSEVFSHALFEELGQRDGHEVFYLACTNGIHRKPNPGTPFLAVNGAANELLLWSANFDRFMLSQVDLSGLMPEFARLLRELEPDVIHFHHVLLIGVEALKVARDRVPGARIVVTLHDYYPICHHNGQMIRANSNELCEKSSPQACNRCFPDLGSDQFLTREVHIKQFFSLVDRFVAPSEFLRQRFVDWGLDEARIEVIRNGSARPASSSPVLADSGGDECVVFGFFGNISEAKGIHVLLDAVDELRGRGEHAFTVHIHGKPWFQTDEFLTSLEARLGASDGRLKHHGVYRREELPQLLTTVDCVLVPSIWWENDPLVIQEAMWAGRPVICADIGGMAEAVRPGIDGLHFRARDASSLADSMGEFVERTTKRKDAFAPATPPTIDAVADRYVDVYLRNLVGRPRTCPTVAPTGA